MRASVAAGLLLVVALAMAAASVVFAVLDGYPDGVTAAAPGLSFAVLGAVLVFRRAAPAIAWLCLAIGISWAGLGAADAIGHWAHHHDHPGVVDAAAWGAWLWAPGLGLLVTHLPLRLPGGSLPSPSWRWWSRLCTLAVVAVGVIAMTDTGPVFDLRGTTNPLGSDAVQAIAPLFVLLPIGAIGALGSLVRRFRRSDGLERLQLRWIASACVVAVAGIAAPAGDAVFILGLCVVPLSIGVAVLRYRLYDLDVVVNRTLVYGALTASLAGVYVGSVLVLQLLLGGVTSDSGLAVAASTLAVAAVFRPLRAQIQRGVDRRFYRRRYDAARTLESFASRLRDETDLTVLGGELRAVIAETMQPAHVSLWLRP